MLIEVEECINNCLKYIKSMEQFILNDNISKYLKKETLLDIKRQYKHIQYLERYNRKWERKYSPG